ncbi:hypothetical protein KY290_001345 [Solanum tuberosum]|uniref:RNase H type-1 domain-containing protein n=1 Tax=Solanum tuberosum TaxID=4113 RepID=A0ABQ7WLV8_SOLTU|nr:hypothetical protein KY290_001345 [Solanum tuberosum]
MEVEVMGVWRAMQYCLTQSFEKIIVETNSLTLKNILTKKWKTPWEQAEKIEEIQKAITVKQVKIKYIFREANSLADSLANIGTEQVETVKAQSFYNLSSRGRRIINVDNRQIPSLRIKTKRIVQAC